MTLLSKLSLLEPEGGRRLRSGVALRRRYGRSDCSLWQLEAKAIGSRINLLPRELDLTGGLLVDVGANVGAWTADVLCLVPGARVLAIEPARDPLEMLKTRFADDARVEVLGVALDAVAGRAKMQITSHSHNSSLLTPRDVNAEYGMGWDMIDVEDVTVQTLDQLVADRPVRLVKIDVQGAEQRVLSGAKECLTRARAVLLEVNIRSHYEGDLLFPDLDRVMRGLNYSLFDLSAPRRNARGAPLWMDACYVNETPG